MQVNDQGNSSGLQKIEIEYQPTNSIRLWTDFIGLISLIQSCFEKINASQRKTQIKKILHASVWHEQYQDRVTKCRVLSENELIEHKHELATAILLTKIGFDILFAPKSMFTRDQKKFDVFLVKNTVILKADLKFITSKNPDTLAKRIKSGSDQASRVVVHINTDIEKKDLIDGLRSGVQRNGLIRELLLFYKGGFYRLPKTLILNKEIFKIIK
jgi:hypothetical protein